MAGYLGHLFLTLCDIPMIFRVKWIP